MATEQQGTAAALPGAWLPHGAMERHTEWTAKGGEMIIRCSSCSVLESELRAVEQAVGFSGNPGELAQVVAAILAKRDATRTELRAAVDALRDMLEDGGLACIDHAERILAAYDAKHPEGTALPQPVNDPELHELYGVWKKEAK